LVEKLPETIESIKINFDHRLHAHPSGEKYPILSKLASFRSCRELIIEITNYKEWEDDLLQLSRCLSKKKLLKIKIKPPLWHCG